MFGFRKKAAPPLCKANPGIGVRAKLALASGDRHWTEELDAVKLAASALKARGYSVRSEKTWLVHAESGFVLLPQLVGLQLLDEGGVRTVTTIQTNHARLVPDGVFEYQHSAAHSAADAIYKGFEQWVQLDFVPLLEALRPKPGSCTALEMEFPPKEGNPARVRRAVLGPIMHFVERPPSKAETTREGDQRKPEDTSEEHPFCPCCLLTKSFEAFRELIEGNGFYGLRLFAARDAEGELQADCRVNGDDWDKGAQALREYARTWPEAGYEFRKQYVVLQSIEKSP